MRKLNAQVLELSDENLYQQAMPIAQRALELSETELGPQHPRTAISLDSLAELHRSTGAYARAAPLYQRALEIREKAFGSEHLETAVSYYNIAILCFFTADYARAESLHQRGLAIRERALGPKHLTVADSLNNLGNVYYATGEYAKALPLHHRALAIREKALGPKHLKTAASLTNLGILYSAMGVYPRAESYFIRAVAIYEKELGPDHPGIGSALGNFSVMYHDTGDYTKAEALEQRVLAIFQKALGPEHTTTANSLNHLGSIYLDTGDYTRAELLYQQALAIREKVLGPEHPRTSDSLGNLASLYSRTGAYAKAEPLHLRALAIRERVLGPDSPRTITSVSRLADMYLDSGAYAKAEPLYAKALASLEKSLGPDHPSTANPLNALANLYRETGAYSQAEPLALRALAIRQKALGAEHPHTASTLNDLAHLYAATGADSKATRLYQQAQEIQAKNSERFLLTGSESRKQAYLQDITKDTHRNVAFSVTAPSPESLALGLTGVLQYKGRVLDAMSGSVARLRQSVKPADRALFDQLAHVANQVSIFTYQGVGNASPEQYRQRLNELTQEQEVLETELAKRSGAFGLQVAPVTLAAVRRALPAGTVLIEWFRYRPFDPKAPRSRAQSGPARYMAYMLRAEGEPSLVDVGDAQVIETSVSEFLGALQSPTRDDVRARARSLSDQIIEPLRAHLDNVDRVVVSPDGMLNLVPMGALLDENDQYLVQRFEITYLTSGRDLLRMASTSPARHGAVVIADPDYGRPARMLPAKSLLAAQRSVDLDRSGLEFRPLTNTAVEAQSLRALLELNESSVMMRGNATESNLKRLHGPRILHVASHGFFLTDQQLTELGSRVHKGEHPLVRAGIALAGANLRRSGPSDDGILTALEVSQLDLHGTELVVLSACETGVGLVQNGEGVYGLRRALFIAGAQTQVATLWKVMDRATSTLMVDYYQGLLKRHGRSAALREAQQKMLATPQRSHPYYWAGFVPIGDWTPLKPNRG